MYNVIIDYGTDSLKIAEKLCEDNSIASIWFQTVFLVIVYTVDSHLLILSIGILLPNYNLLIY